MLSAYPLNLTAAGGKCTSNAGYHEPAHGAGRGGGAGARDGDGFAAQRSCTRQARVGRGTTQARVRIMFRLLAQRGWVSVFHGELRSRPHAVAGAKKMRRPRIYYFDIPGLGS